MLKNRLAATLAGMLGIPALMLGSGWLQVVGHDQQVVQVAFAVGGAGGVLDAVVSKDLQPASGSSGHKAGYRSTP